MALWLLEVFLDPYCIVVLRVMPDVVNFLATRIKTGVDAETRARTSQSSSITIVGTMSIFRSSASGELDVEGQVHPKWYPNTILISVLSLSGEAG